MKQEARLAALVLILLMMPFAASRADDAEEAVGDHETVFWQGSDCDSPPDGTAMRIRLSEVKNGDGNIRVALYNMNDDEFLKSGARIARIDVRAEEGDMDICLPLPRAGDFSMAVLHDEDADGKLDVFSEGYGFPGNPRLFFSPPKAADASFTVKEAETVVLPITMKYVYPNRSNRGPRRR